MKESGKATFYQKVTYKILLSTTLVNKMAALRLAVCVCVCVCVFVWRITKWAKSGVFLLSFDCELWVFKECGCRTSRWWNAINEPPPKPLLSHLLATIGKCKYVGFLVCSVGSTECALAVEWPRNNRLRTRSQKRSRTTLVKLGAVGRQADRRTGNQSEIEMGLGKQTDRLTTSKWFCKIQIQTKLKFKRTNKWWPINLIENQLKNNF